MPLTHGVTGWRIKGAEDDYLDGIAVMLPVLVAFLCFLDLWVFLALLPWLGLEGGMDWANVNVVNAAASATARKLFFISILPGGPSARHNSILHFPRQNNDSLDRRRNVPNSG
jgi:hypothetical protein